VSHVTEIKTKITDLAALEVACSELGFHFMRDQKTFVRYQSIPGSCEHAIRVGGCSYEVGVVKQGDGSYQLAYDPWYSGGLGARIGENAGPLVQSYAKHKTIREAARLGHRVVAQQVLKDGSIKLVLQAGGGR
jgi:hypothetical protein